MRRRKQLLEPSGGGGGKAALALAAGKLLLVPAQVALAKLDAPLLLRDAAGCQRQLRARPGHVAPHALTAPAGRRDPPRGRQTMPAESGDAAPGAGACPGHSGGGRPRTAGNQPPETGVAAFSYVCYLRARRSALPSLGLSKAAV